MGGYSEGEVEVGSTKVATLQNLIKPFVGAGILALPNAFLQGGLVTSAILLILIALASYYCMACLMECAAVMEQEWENYDKQHHNQTPNQNQAVLSLGDGSSNNGGAGGDDSKQEYQQVAMADSSASSASASASVSVSDSSAGGDGDGNGDGDLEADEDRQELEAFRTRRHRVVLFGDIAGYAFGRVGRTSLNVSLVVSQVGFCIAYVSFISSNMHSVATSISRVDWIWIAFIPFVLLCQIRKIKYIAGPSAIGNAVYLFAIISVFYYGFSKSCCITGSELKLADFGGLPFVFGTASFALEGIGLVLPVKYAMQEPKQFMSVLKVALVIITSAYMSFAVLGYLFFGEHTNSVITKNLGSGGLADAVRVSLSIVLTLSYAIQMFPVTELMDLKLLHYFERKQLEDESNSSLNSSSSSSSDSPTSASSSSSSAAVPLSSSDANTDGKEGGRDKLLGAGKKRGPIVLTSNRQYWLYVVGTLGRVAIIVFTCFLASVFENFGLVVSLMGSLSNSLIVFILPSFYFLKLCRPYEPGSANIPLTAAQQNPDCSAARSTNPTYLPRSVPLQWSKLNWKFAWVPVLVMVVGTLSSAVGLYFSLKDIIDPPAEN